MLKRGALARAHPDGRTRLERADSCHAPPADPCPDPRLDLLDMRLAARRAQVQRSRGWQPDTAEWLARLDDRHAMFGRFAHAADRLATYLLRRRPVPQDRAQVAGFRDSAGHACRLNLLDMKVSVLQVQWRESRARRARTATRQPQLD